MRPSPRLAWGVLLACALVWVSPARLRAFDVDTHYVWTYYLALHVGYTPRQAFQIASAAFAIDHDRDTSPMEAGVMDAVFGAEPLSLASNPRLADIWRRFHAFTDRFQVENSAAPEVFVATDLMMRLATRRWAPSFTLGSDDDYREVGGFAGEVGGQIDRTRQDNAAALWLQARRDRNPGPLIHYTQDYFSHFEFTDLRGHAVAGHLPDFLGFNPNRSRAMTMATVDVLRRFKTLVLRETPKVPDFQRVVATLDRLAAASPVPDESAAVASRFQNYNPFAEGPPAAPSRIRALQVIETAIAEDRRSGRLPEIYAGSRVNMPDRWLQYDYCEPDARGAVRNAEAWRDCRGQVRDASFPVENLRVTIENPGVDLSLVPGSPNQAVRARFHARFTIAGMADLNPQIATLPVLVTARTNDPNFEDEHRRELELANGSQDIERAYQWSAALLQRHRMVWTLRIWPHGLDPITVDVPVTIDDLNRVLGPAGTAPVSATPAPAAAGTPGAWMLAPVTRFPATGVNEQATTDRTRVRTVTISSGSLVDRQIVEPYKINLTATWSFSGMPATLRPGQDITLNVSGAASGQFPDPNVADWESRLGVTPRGLILAEPAPALRLGTGRTSTTAVVRLRAPARLAGEIHLTLFIFNIDGAVGWVYKPG